MGRLETYSLATGSTGDPCIPTVIGVTTVNLLTYDAFPIWYISDFSCLMQTMYCVNNKYGCNDQNG